jgi:anti-anti-sigma regulatory factor
MGSAGQTAFAVERSVLGDGSVRLAVAGALDTMSSSDLLDLLVDGIVPGGRLVVDLAAVTRLDETAIAALTVAAHLAALHDAECRVIGCSSETEQMLSTSGPVRRTALPDPFDPSR